MNTQEFLSLLEANPNKELLFEYREGRVVGANYHITEVKNIIVDAVDCGGRTDYWKETVVQLWESPSEIGKRDFMHTDKALSILNRVDGMKPMTRDAVLRFEYSNPDFHTAQLFVAGFQNGTDRLVLRLVSEQTDCKAKEECAPELVASGTEANGCAPGSGCC